MKVKIGPYERWFGPYQLAEALCFWAKPVKDEWGIESKPDWVHNFGEWLAHGSVAPEPTKENPVSRWGEDRPITLLYKFLTWLHSKKVRRIEIRIDNYDTWSMDNTLAYIVLPMLEQLKATKHGAPFVDDKDVPKELRSTSAPPLSENDKDCGAVDDLHFKRWDWVLDEMIFAFERKVDDSWEDAFRSGEMDWQHKACAWDDAGKPTMYQSVDGPNHTYKCDYEGMKKVEERIANGFRLFGKYYQGLWD